MPAVAQPRCPTLLPALPAPSAGRLKRPSHVQRLIAEETGSDLLGSGYMSFKSLELRCGPRGGAGAPQRV